MKLDIVEIQNQGIGSERYIFGTPKPLVFIVKEGISWNIFVLHIHSYKTRNKYTYYRKTAIAYRNARLIFKDELKNFFLDDHKDWFQNWPVK